MVGKVGLEPTRHCWLRVLSAKRLPIPSHPHRLGVLNLQSNQVNQKTYCGIVYPRILWVLHRRATLFQIHHLTICFPCFSSTFSCCRFALLLFWWTPPLQRSRIEFTCFFVFICSLNWENILYAVRQIISSQNGSIYGLSEQGILYKLEWYSGPDDLVWRKKLDSPRVEWKRKL